MDPSQAAPRQLIAAYKELAAAVAVPLTDEEASSDCSFIVGLRSYAAERVAAERSQITQSLREIREVAGASNLSAHRLKLDIALPGAAYFSIAAGGLVEVLYELSEAVEVDRAVGASGGAASGFLMLADAHTNTKGAGPGATEAPVMFSSETLLMTYLLYSRAESGGAGAWLNAFRQLFSGVSDFWSVAYRYLLRRELAMQTVQSRAFVAVLPRALQPSAQGDGPPRFKPRSHNYIFSGFETVDQVVNAFVATGEASVFGLLRGIDLVSGDATFTDADGEACSICSRFHDGGSPVPFSALDHARGAASTPPNALLYYHTFFREYSQAMVVSRHSIDTLFRRGVDAAVCLLTLKHRQPAGSLPSFCTAGNWQVFTDTMSAPTAMLAVPSLHSRAEVEPGEVATSGCSGWLNSSANLVDISEHRVWQV